MIGLVTLLFAACLSTSTVYGQLTPEEEQALTELIEENIEITADYFKDKCLNEVCDATFYKVKQVPKYKSNGEYSEILLVQTDSGYCEVSWANDLLPVLDDEFKLTSQEEAQTFEKLLDKLFPVFSSSEKQIIQQENKWIFVRSERWGEIEGTIVTVNDAGAVINIESNQTITLP